MTKNSEYPLLDLNAKYDMFILSSVCPKCGDKKAKTTPLADVGCKSCGNKYKTEFKQSIYTKVARSMNSYLAYNNGLIIRGAEKYESEIVNMKEHFTAMNNWDVSKIKEYYEYHKRCRECGICLSCLTCKECGKAFKKKNNVRIQKCSCGSTKSINSYFKEVLGSKQNYMMRLCPHCKSDKVIMTRTTDLTKCSICGSKELSNKKSERKFELVIEKKKGYRN